MGEFIPPTDGKIVKKNNTSNFIPPSDSVELKKKEESKPTATPPKLDSGTSTGSSGGVKIPKFDINEFKTKQPIPKSEVASVVKDKTPNLKPNIVPVATAQEKQKFALKRQQDAQLAAKISTELYASNDKKAEQMTKDQEEGNGFFNTIKGFGDIVVNKVGNFLRDPIAEDDSQDEVKDHPFQEQINQVKKADTKNELSPDQVLLKARELKKEENNKAIIDDKVTNFMTSADDHTKEILRVNEMAKIPNLNKQQKSITAQISLLKQRYDATTDEVEKQAIGEKYKSLLADDAKIKNDKMSAEEHVRQFALNYSPIDNILGKTIAGVSSMAGKALYNLGSLDKTIGGYDDNVFTVTGQKLADVGDKMQGNFHQESLESVANSEHPVYALGRHLIQTVAGIVPYVGLGAENAVISNTSKAVMIMSGAGGKTMQMHKEMEENPSVKYTPLQIFGASAGYAGAEALMAGELGTIFKGSKNAVGAIMKSPFAKEQFEQGMKSFAIEAFDGISKMGGKMIHSAKLGASMEAVKIATDEIVLGKKIDNKGAKILSSAIDMGALPLILEAIPSVGGHIISKFSPKIDVTTVHNNLLKINEYSKALEDKSLTPEAKDLIQTSIDKLTKENATKLKKTTDAIQNFTKPQIEKVLTIEGRKTEIRNEVEAIKSPENNAPNNIKAEALAEKKAEWKKLEMDREDIFSNPFNAINILPDATKRKNEASRELMKEQNPDGTKKITLDDAEISERALKNYQKELSIQKENEQNSPTPTPETEPQAEVQKSTDETQEIEEVVVPETKEVEVEEEVSAPLSESIDAKGIYYLNGEKGEIKLDGQTVVFETGNKIIELGNKDDLSNSKLSDFNINKEEELDISLNDDNSFDVRGKKYYNKYSNPESAISKDKEGNYVVTLDTENGQKRTFRGQQAEQMVYQTMLKNFENNGTEEQINRANEIADESIRVETEIRKTPAKRENKSVKPVESEKVNATIQETTSKPNGDIRPRTERVEEVRTTKPKTPSKESVSSTADIGKGKEDVEVKKPTTKEKIAERVKLSDAKIDDWKNAVKDIDSIFGIKIKVDDIEGLNKQGVDIVDVIANIAKQAVSAGIHIDEAINKTIEHLKKTLDFEVNIDEIKERINPKKEPLFVDENGDKYTSLKNAISNPEREAKGKDVVIIRDGKTDAERKKELHDDIDSGKISEEEIRDITTALANNDVDQVATRFSKADMITILLHNKVTLENKNTEIRKELEANKGTDKEGQSLLDLARNEMLEDENYLASAALKGEWSEMGRNLQDAMKEDYSRPAIIKKLEDAAGNKDLSPEFRKKAGEVAQEIKDLQTKLDEHQAKYDKLEADYKDKEAENADLQEKISKHEAERKLEKEKKLQSLKSKKEFKIADIEKKQKLVIDRLREKYKGLSGTLNAGINPKYLELAPDVAILAKYEIQKGAATLEEVIGKVLIQLQDVIPELAERDVRDLFSGYGKSVIPKDVSENERTLRKLKSKARAISGLQDVREDGTAPLRTGYSHPKPSEEVLAIRREIQREMRAKGIDMKNAKDPEAVWKTALESYKTRTQNRIDYLENIAKSKDIEKYLREKKRTKLKLDEEARDLKKQQQNKKNVVDDMVAKADFETWNKFRKGTHYAARYFKGNLISAPTTVVKILASVAWRSAYKPIQAVSMYGVSKVAKMVGSDISRVQGINSLKDLTDHIMDYYRVQYSKENLKGFKDTFKNHTSTEDVLLGKHYAQTPLPKIRGNKDLNFAQKMFFGHLKFLENISAASHGATKNMAALPEHKAWSNTILRNLIKEGIPESMLQDGTAIVIADHLGYLKGQRARFMQQNSLSSKKTAEVAQMVNKNMPLVADIIDMAFPILKIGSNYVGEALEKMPVIGLAAHGAIMAGKRIGEPVFKETQKADLLRALSNQGVGAFSLLAGAMLYQNINGFYGTDAEEYAKKHGKNLPDDEEAIGVLKGLYTHSPDAVMMKAGAQMMWYWDMYDKEHPGENMSNIMSSIFNWQTTASIINQSPYISSSENTIAILLDKNGDFGKAAANFIRGRIPFGDMTKTIAQGELPIFNKTSPELGKEIAKKLGMNPETVKPYEVGIYPKGFVNNVGIGIPGWRDKILKELMVEKNKKHRKTSAEIHEAIQTKREKEKLQRTFKKEHK